MMQNHSTGPLSSFFHQRSLRRWERLADVVKNANPATLKELRKRARAIENRAANVANIAKVKLDSQPGDTVIDGMKPATDWACRPDFWACYQENTGHAPAKNNTSFARDVTLYHDCKSSSVSVRQMRNHGVEYDAPFGLHLDIYQFSGSFLSIVVRAPDGITHGLTKSHILGVSSHFECERAIEISLRLNLKNGPNTEQVNKIIDPSSRRAVTEFDLAYVPFKESRTEQVWFDLFFDDPAMNGITLRDLTLFRRQRADL